MLWTQWPYTTRWNKDSREFFPNLHHWCYNFSPIHTRSPFNRWVDWTNVSKVSRSRKQQQHQSVLESCNLSISRLMSWPLGFAASHMHTYTYARAESMVVGYIQTNGGSLCTKRSHKWKCKLVGQCIIYNAGHVIWHPSWIMWYQKTNRGHSVNILSWISCQECMCLSNQKAITLTQTIIAIL